MNWVDSLALLIIVISAVVAFARGFIAEVLGIAAWVGAFFVASSTAHLLRPTMRGWLGNSEIADPAAYAAVFLLSLIVLSILTGMIGGAVRASLLGSIDRTLGIGFGVARGLVILAAIYVGTGLIFTSDRWPAPVADARSVSHIHDLAVMLVRLLPEDYRPPVPTPPMGRPTSAASLLQATPQGRPTARP